MSSPRRILNLSLTVCLAVMLLPVLSLAPAVAAGPSYEFVRSWPDTPRAVFQPRQSVVLASGNIAVADTGNDRVKILTPSGDLVTQWGSRGTGNGEFSSPYGVAASPSGTIYVVDTNNHRVQAFESDGTFVRKWGSQGSGTSQFFFPRGIALDPATGNVFVSDTFNHRIQVFSATGTYLSTFGSFGSTSGKLNGAHGIAIYANRVYVTDTNNHRIQKFTTAGAYVTQWGQYEVGSDTLSRYAAPTGVYATAAGVFIADTGNDQVERCTDTGASYVRWGSSGTGPGQFDGPAGVVSDASGNVYVSDTLNSRMQKLDSSGSWLATWQAAGAASGSLAGPRGVAAGPTDDVFVADSDNGRVQRFSSSGTYEVEWSTQLNTPAGIAVDGAGNIYVADAGANGVRKFDSDGTYLTGWSGVTGPMAIAVDGSGNVYVADTGGDRVRKFTSTGGAITSWTGLSEPEGIAIDDAGYVYVVDTGTNSVKKFTSSGGYVDGWGSTGSSPGKFIEPRGVAALPNGNILVADSGNERVQEFTPDGTFVAAFGSSGAGELQFHGVSDVAVMSSGSIVIIESRGCRVQEALSDGTPPVTNASVDPVGWSTAPVVTLQASDTGSGVAATYYRIGAGSQSTYGAPFAVTSPEGAVTVTYWSVDNAGNRESDQTVTAYVDRTPPATQADALSGWRSQPVTVTLTATDVFSGVAETSYNVAGDGPFEYTGPFAVDREGASLVSFLSVDNAGNTETPSSITVQVDLSPPTDPSVSSTSHTPWVTSAVANIDIVLSGSSDAHSGVDGYSISWSEDGTETPDDYKDREETDTTFTELLGDGNWYVNVRTVDNVGNWTSTGHAGPFIIDTEAPTTNSDIVEDWQQGPVSVTLEAVGEAATYYRIDGSDPETYTGSFEVSGEGAHSVEFWSVDDAGNEETPHQSATVKIDNTAPHTTDNAENRYRGSATIALSAEDALSGVENTYYYFKGGTQVSGTSVSTSEQGHYVLYYWSVDEAGNEEDHHEVAFTVATGPTKKQFAGSDRYGTAIALSEYAFPAGIEEVDADGYRTVVVATGEAWPDAASASALGGAVGGPVLLTPSGYLHSGVASEIARLGANRAIVVGGPAAVSEGVRAALLGLPGISVVKRVSGRNREETSRLCAAEVVRLLGASFDGTVIVATGGSYADAVAAAPMAVANGWPIVLVHAGASSLDSGTRASMVSLGADEVVVLGGIGAVSGGVFAGLDAMSQITSAIRLRGEDRYETAARIADFCVSRGSQDWSVVGIGTGEDYPDALTGGVLLGREGGVLLLVRSDSVPAATETSLTAHGAEILDLVYLGGTAAVSSSTRIAIESLVQ